MAKGAARGKALVAKLGGTPGVRDPEALAAYAGRTKRIRKAGASPSKAASLANKEGGTKKGGAANKGRKLAGLSKKPGRVSGNEEAPTRDEAKRVSPGNPNATKLADRFPLAAGMKVQTEGRKEKSGTVVGVTRDSRIKVRTADGSTYTAERSNLLINAFDPNTRRIGEDLARKETLKRFKARK